MSIPFSSSMLKVLDINADTIKSTASDCWASRTSVDEIIKMMEREFVSSRERRIALFYMINDLLQNSASSSDLSFVKVVGLQSAAHQACIKPACPLQGPIRQMPGGGSK